MAKETLDCLGLKCPQPVLKVALLSRKLPAGTVLEVLADCPAFPADIKKWCLRQGRVLLCCLDMGKGQYRAEVLF